MGDNEKELTQKELRFLIVTFMRQYDPARLDGGMDIDGVVKWTFRNGNNLEKLNEAFFLKKYGRGLDRADLYKNEKGPKKLTDVEMSRYMSVRMSPAVYKSMAVFLSGGTPENVKRQIRRNLEEFYEKHDKKKLADKYQFDRIVNSTILQGVPAINKKLVALYGEGIPEVVDEGDVEEVPENNMPEVEYKIKEEDLDITQLMDDLEAYFVYIEKESHTQELDTIVDYIRRIGFEAFNMKSNQLYGRVFDDVMKDLGKQPYFRRIKEIGVKEMEVEESLEQFEGRQERSESDEEELETKPFEEMTDEEISKELFAFYSFHDEANLEKLPQMVVLAKDLGRDELNEFLFSLYYDRLRKDRNYAYDGEEGGDQLPMVKRQDTIFSLQQKKTMSQNEIDEILGMSPPAEEELPSTTIAPKNIEETPPPPPPPMKKAKRQSTFREIDPVAVLEEVKVFPSMSEVNASENKLQQTTDAVVGQSKRFNTKKMPAQGEKDLEDLGKLKKEKSGKSSGLISAVIKSTRKLASTLPRKKKKDKKEEKKKIEKPVPKVPEENEYFDGPEFAKIAKQKTEKFAKGESEVTGADGEKELWGYFNASVNTPRKLVSDEDDGASGVAAITSKFNKKGGAVPQFNLYLPAKGLIERIKKAEAEGDTKNPLLILTSTRVRENWDN